jgi:riboflavin synthase
VFTGIIREAGRVGAIRIGTAGAVLAVEAPRTRASLERGGSVAVDGVCLTVTRLLPDAFEVEMVPETLRRTRLGSLVPGDRVNLELPLKMGDPLDGHLVQGHVDGIGTVREVRPDGIGTWVEIDVDAALRPFLAEKGSAAVNGVSLTIAAARPSGFAVALIPTTLELTNLKDLRRGSQVNLEVDVLARYVLHHREVQG